MIAKTLLQKLLLKVAKSYKVFSVKKICKDSILHFCPVHSIFCFSFFGHSDQNLKNQLSCLFIFCIKNHHFARRDSLFFHFLATLTKTKNKKLNEPH